MAIWINEDIFNLTNATTEPPGEDGRGLITMSTFVVVKNVAVALQVIICTFGMVTNGLSIKAFYTIGIEDSVTTILFFQSVLDFLYLLTNDIFAISGALTIFEKEFNIWFEVTPESLQVIMATVVRMFIEPSYLVGTFLAVQRYLCVAMPLHFKGLFTRKRNIIILVLIVIFSASIYPATLSQHTFIKVIVPPHNRTRYVLVFAKHRDIISEIADYIFYLGLTIVNQCVVTFCVIFMVNALIRSVRFRSKTKSSSAAVEQDPTEAKKRDGPNKESSSVAVLRDTKELLIIRQVVMVCGIYAICNIPRLVFILATMIEPEFDMFRRYNLLFMLTYCLQITFEYLSVSLNFFVFFKYNSRFRKACFRETITQ